MRVHDPNVCPDKDAMLPSVRLGRSKFTPCPSSPSSPPPAPCQPSVELLDRFLTYRTGRAGSQNVAPVSQRHERRKTKDESEAATGKLTLSGSLGRRLRHRRRRCAQVGGTPPVSSSSDELQDWSDIVRSTRDRGDGSGTVCKLPREPTGAKTVPRHWPSASTSARTATVA